MAGALSRAACAALGSAESLAATRALVDARLRQAERTDGAAPRADRAGGVGITSIYRMPPRQWGRGGEVREGERTCWV